MSDYTYRREQIYRPLRTEGTFTWDWLYGKEYALATLHSITEPERKELLNATEQLGRVFTKTVAVVQHGSRELMAELGIPPAAMEAVRLNVLGDTATLIGRFDFVRTASGWKMLEFNSDTPGGVVEAFYVNGKVCGFYNAADPNAGLDVDLTEAFQHILDQYRSLGYKTENVFFSALDWHEEDAGTARYLLKQSQLNSRFIPLKDLFVENELLYALVDTALTPVDVLYRLHPLGVLAEDKDTDGYPTGEHVLELVASRSLAVVNPPGALIAQTKALQALIWSLYEDGDFFVADEKLTIERYMLPTYFENRFIGHCPYVVKPVLGREGGGITICNLDGTIVEQDREQYYWDQLMVYQKYQELESVELETMDGLYQGRLLWGSFLVNGKGSAIAARAGGHITDDLSYFVPVCVK